MLISKNRDEIKTDVAAPSLDMRVSTLALGLGPNSLNCPPRQQAEKLRKAAGILALIASELDGGM